MEALGLELDVGGRRNSHCFYISVFFLMAFLPFLYVFLGLGKSSLCSVLRIYYVFSVNSAPGNVRTGLYSSIIP